MNASKHAWNNILAANVQGTVSDQGSFTLLLCSTQSNHISHFQCKDFIVSKSCSTNTPPEVQQSRSTRVSRNPRPRMIKVTVHETQRVNELGTTNPRKQTITQITTSRRPDNTRSSALVREPIYQKRRENGRNITSFRACLCVQ